GLGPRHDGQPFGRAGVLPHRRRALAPDPAGADARLLQGRADRAPGPRHRPRSAAHGLHQVRARQGPQREPHRRRACAEEHHDPDRHGERPGVRPDRGLRRGHRDGVLLARHGQALDRFHPAARPAGGGGLPRGHRLLLRHPEPRGRSPLFGARPPRAPRKPRDMADAALDPVATARPQTPFQRVVSDFCESRLAVFGLFLVAISAFVALFAPWISPQNPFDIASLDLLDAKVPPGTVSSDGKMVYWLGTDGQARDMLSAIFYGMRISLFVGAVSVVIALAIGVVVGLVAAYAGGKVDALLMRIVDLMLSFPAILVALILLSVLGKGIDKVLFALILVQ